MRDPRIGADHAVVVDDGVVADHRTGTDAHVLADDDVVAQRRGLVDPRALGDPQTLSRMDAGDEQLHLAVEDVAVHLHVGFLAADVAPVAVGRDPVDRMPVLHQRREEVRREVVALPCRDVVQYPRLDDVDAGVDRVAEDLTPRRLLQEALHEAVLGGDDDAEVERVGHALERDGDRAAALLVEANDLAEVDVGDRVP